MYSTPEELQRLMDQFQPLKELGPDNRGRLAIKSRIVEIRPGLRINASEEHRWMSYLVSGKINLVSDGKSQVLASDAERAMQPVFHQDRLRDYAVVLTVGHLLRVDRQLYEALRKDESDTGIELEDMELTQVEGLIFTALYQACLDNSLSLPSMPEVALQIRKASEDPGMDLGRMSRIVQMDLAVTGGLIKAANSAMYGGSAPVSHVRDAIRRLGMDATRRLVIGIAMGSVFKTDAPALKDRMHQLWNDSVQISALSFVIARHCGLDPDHALLAGLLHDVGVVPILDFVGRYHPDTPAEELEHIIIKLHSMAGELVINHWGLGPDMSQVVREADAWFRTGGTKADFCDVVQVARLYAYSRQGRTDLPRFDSVPAFERLRLNDVSEGDRIDPLEEAESEIKTVTELLRGD